MLDKDCQFFLYDGKITGNTSGDGGAIYLNQEPSWLIMQGGEISGNTATGNGGGVYIYRSGSVCQLYSGKIENNKASGNGGGIYINPSNSGQLKVGNKPIVQNNTAKNGGAFFSTTGGTINMTGGTISGNKATQNSNNAGGGAIYMRGNGKIDISGSAEITGNSSSLDGGAILMGWGEINISDSAKINSNTASRWGGAICLRQDSNQTTILNMRGGEISGNKANSEGGAVHVLDKD